MPDHCHLLCGLNPTQAISKLVSILKANSSKWINEQRIFRSKFNWQIGYGAFSHSRSQLDTVVKYIRNQPQHHAKKNFKKEYIEFLDKFQIDYQTDYLFDWINE